MISLSQKEKMLLQDQKSHEEMCIKKYNAASEQAKDPALKELFSSLAGKEEEHLDTINQILSGKVPTLSSSSSSSNSSPSLSGSAPNLFNSNSTDSSLSFLSGMSDAVGVGTSTSSSLEGQFSSQTDKDLCSDLLATEKFVSSAYDTAIFECTQDSVRNALNHIQTEEQEHGKAIYDYMNANGMYNVQ